MSSVEQQQQQQQFQGAMQNLTKKYLSECLTECSRCWDLSMNEECSANCDKSYLLFNAAKRILKDKLKSCLEQSQQLQDKQQKQKAQNQQKAMAVCYAAATKDTASLDQFVSRVGSQYASSNQKVVAN